MKELPDWGLGPFRFDDQRQKRIHERLLRLVGPGPAEFYHDACRLVAVQPPFRATTHLVCHCLREMESALRDVLENLASYSQSEIVTGSGDKHAAEIRGILAGLAIPETDPLAEFWMGLAGQGNEYGLQARTHRRRLAAPRPFDEEFRDFWEKSNILWDNLLDRFEARFAAVVNSLDSLLEKKTPTRADAERLANNFPENPVLRGTFFARAGAEWLEPLRAAGFFDRIPPAVSSEGGVRWAMWPESQYLARIAAGPGDLQQAVLGVILPIAETTNGWVQEDFLDAALAMQPMLASQLVQPARTWFSSPVAIGVPEKAGKLIRHLAIGGQAAAALELARFVLQPKPGRLRRAESTYELDVWHYEQIIKNDVPELVREAGWESFLLLCDLLLDAVRGTADPKADKFWDHSQIWRPAIEEHSQNQLSSIESALVGAVRDAAEAIIKNEPGRIASVLVELEARKFLVFRRLALHVLRTAPATSSDLLENYLVDRNRFLDHGLLPEYAFLLRSAFTRLLPAGRAAVLSWIEQGRELDRNKYRDFLRTEITDDDAARYARHWQFEKLGYIEDSLPPVWRNRYESLSAEFGKPTRPPEFQFWSTSWVGPTSPKTKGELRELDDTELLVLLRDWQPSDEARSPSREGLARELSNLVAEQPRRFCSLAEAMRGLDSAYIRAAVRGFRTVVANGGSLEWPRILSLCAWAVEQYERSASNRSGYQSERSGLGEDIAYLFQEGLASRHSENGVPFALRQGVWNILEPITDDPDPSPEREGGNDSQDPYGIAINSARGTAIEAVIAYALWVRRHLPEGSARAAGLMPEVREILERHLDPSVDSSLAIRSVYGRSFPHLVYLDPEWAGTHVRAIFPRSAEHVRLRETAWESYLGWNDFYEPCFDLLEEEYSTAVDRIASDGGGEATGYSPEGHLAAHLMILHWRGRLSFDEASGLLARFFASASGGLRAEAIEFVGRKLPIEKSELANEVRERLERLWQWRIAAARDLGSSADHQKELGAFAWWFASNQFSDSWALARLGEALQLTRVLAHHHIVIERLAELAETLPGEAVEFLRLLLEKDEQGIVVLGNRDELKTILRAATRSGEPQTKRAGLDLANRLVARGHFDFRDLT